MKAIERNGRPSRNHRPLLAVAFTFLMAPCVGVPASAATLPCSGVAITIGSGSELSLGWVGTTHQRDLPVGATSSWAVAGRCTNNQDACDSNADCGGGECVATCDCNGDVTCEIAGPVEAGQCLNTRTQCLNNADCPPSVACMRHFSPPISFALGTAPFCAVADYDGEASGTFNAQTGETSLSVVLRTQLYLGISTAQPCPRCGTPEQNPSIGDVFTCEGGQFAGEPCTVEGVTPIFGGTSSDCPPAVGDKVTGSGLLFRISDLGTDSTTRTAALPCANASFTPNPLNPASNPKCIDDTAGPVCSSNADCRRCTGDPSIKCSGNGNCTSNGVCAEAPDQPVTCGYWCHCGFCNNDPAQPCFESSECADGQTCQKGTGGVAAANSPQMKPNECSQDKFICGTAENERCEITQVRSCSLAPYLGCNENADCANAFAGTCVSEDKRCFESRITRSGEASPLGMYCAFEDKTCASNADCATSGDFCASDASRPQMAALFCVPASTSTAVNNFAGITGPAELHLNGFVQVCRCAAGESGCEALCGIAPSDCGNEVVDAGEDCDGGPCCQGDCSYSSTATTCRASASDCDKAENCSGTSANCPANSFQPNGTACDDGDQCTTEECVGGVCETTPIHPCNGQCGDGSVDEGEACDDGNKTFTPGEYCGVDCVRIPCGKPTNSTGVLPKSSDALFVLKAAVSGTLCDPRVCSVDGNETVLASDALRILKAAVAQVIALVCPTT